MKFVPMEKMPRFIKLGKKYKIQAYLEEFENMNVKCVKVELSEGEYKSVKYAQSSFLNSIKRFGNPVKARITNGELYLVRTDM